MSILATLKIKCSWPCILFLPDKLRHKVFNTFCLITKLKGISFSCMLLKQDRIKAWGHLGWGDYGSNHGRMLRSIKNVTCPPRSLELMPHTMKNSKKCVPYFCPCFLTLNGVERYHKQWGKIYSNNELMPSAKYRVQTIN